MIEYRSEADYRHGAEASTGVLLVNLGTPDEPTRPALRRYLKEFLWDPRVVEMARPLWWLILNGVILNLRPSRSARAYQSVWGDEGSPLMVISKRQTQALRESLAKALPHPPRLELAMRYGNPSIREGLERLQHAGARRIFVLPMYPQYSATTVGSVFDAVADTLKTWRWVPELRFLSHYHDDAGYIAALSARIRAAWEGRERGECLLFSFHGLPQRYFDQGDPYFCHCQKTARLTAQALGLEDDQWRVSFQSRFGREPWLQPYTDHLLKDLARKGMRRVDVVCPGFAADCLETLEEIAVENRDYFLHAGGEHFHYIPALNDAARHIEALTALILRNIQGWPEAAPDWDTAQAKIEAQASRERALMQGAER